MGPGAAGRPGSAVISSCRRRPRDPPPQVVVWPESAVPYQVEREPEVRSLLGEVAPAGGALLVGGDRYELERRPAGRAQQPVRARRHRRASRARYDKVDLVPFGEFLPFRRGARPARPAQADRGHDRLRPRARAGSRCTLPGLPPASPLICYEAAFPGEATGAGRAAGLAGQHHQRRLVRRSSGPFQHLAMARMRAVEEGLPLVRAANTGISAVIDAYGRVRGAARHQRGRRDRRGAAGGAAEARRSRAVLAPWLLPALLLVVAAR